MKETLREAALQYLSRYAASSEGLRRVLLRKIRRKATSDAEATAARAHLAELLQRFEEVGLLDDTAYAEARARHLNGRGKSIRAIQADLAGRGIDRVDADRAVSGLCDLEAARSYARRRRLSSDQRDRARLARRGFSWDVVRTVLCDPDAPSDR